MKTKDIRALSKDELEAQLSDSHEELMKLRFQLSSGELTDYTRIRAMRRQIATMQTVLNEYKRNPETEVSNE